MIQPRLWPLTRVDPAGSIVDAVAGALQRQQVFRELGFPNRLRLQGLSPPLPVTRLATAEDGQ